MPSPQAPGRSFGHRRAQLGPGGFVLLVLRGADCCGSHPVRIVAVLIQSLGPALLSARTRTPYVRPRLRPSQTCEVPAARDFRSRTQLVQPSEVLRRIATTYAVTG